MPKPKGPPQRPIQWWVYKDLVTESNTEVRMKLYVFYKTLIKTITDLIWQMQKHNLTIPTSILSELDTCNHQITWLNAVLRADLQEED